MPLWLVRYAPQLLGVLLVAGLAAAGYRAAWERGRDAERSRWERATAEAAERFSEALAAQQATLEAADAEVARLRKSANRRREAVSDAIQSDPVSRDWADAPVPERMRWALGDRGVSADPEKPDGSVRP
jgi:hypothetical protein